MDKQTVKSIFGIADVCISENGIIYTGQAAQEIQRCWRAMDSIKQLPNVEEMINAFETNRYQSR